MVDRTRALLRLPVQVLNYIAGGRDITSGVSYVCQGIIRGPAVPLVKRLAYDVVHAAALTDADWDNVIEGLKSDLAGTFSLEVQLSAHLGMIFIGWLGKLMRISNTMLSSDETTFLLTFLQQKVGA